MSRIVLERYRDERHPRCVVEPRTAPAELGGQVIGHEPYDPACRRYTRPDMEIRCPILAVCKADQFLVAERPRLADQGKHRAGGSDRAALGISVRAAVRAMKSGNKMVCPNALSRDKCRLRHRGGVRSRRPSGLRKTKSRVNSLAHRTTWLRSDLLEGVIGLPWGFPFGPLSEL